MTDPTRAETVRRSRPVRVAEAIKEWVVEKGLAPGDRLPGEAELIARFAMSKGTIREAMRLLHDGAVSGSGWVDVRPLADGAKAFQDIHNGTAPPKIVLDIS